MVRYWEAVDIRASGKTEGVDHHRDHDRTHAVDAADVDEGRNAADRRCEEKDETPERAAEKEGEENNKRDDAVVEVRGVQAGEPTGSAREEKGQEVGTDRGYRTREEDGGCRRHLLERRYRRHHPVSR